MAVTLLFGVLAVLLLIGVPVAFALLGAAPDPDLQVFHPHS